MFRYFFLMICAGWCFAQDFELHFARMLEGSTSGAASAISSGGRLFAAGSDDGLVRIWDLSKAAPAISIPVLTGAVRAVAFDPDDALLVMGDADARLVNVETRAVTRLPGRWGPVGAVAASREAIAWAAPQSVEVQVRSRTSDTVLRKFAGHYSPVLGLAFSPDGERLAAGEFFRFARLWSMRCNCLQQNFSNRSSELRHLSFSRDGRSLAAVSDSGIQVSEVVSGRETVRLYPRSGSFVAAAFQPDGSLVAITSDAGLRLWRSDPLPSAVGARSRPALHILVVGINSYADPGLHLGFAEQDASDLAAAFEQHAVALPYQPRATRILGPCATKAEIAEALAQIAAEAKPEDALLVFMAGHGRQEAGEFWYYTHRYRGTDRLPGEALAGSEIARLLAAVPARRQMLILDACQSGAAVERIRDAFLRLSPGQRQFQILSASASTEEAMEVEAKGHGLLTSTLLDRLNTRFKAGDGESASGWLKSAAAEVPAIAAAYNKSGSQKPDWKSFGADFPIVSPGRVPVSAVRVRPQSAQAAPSAAEFGDEFTCRPTAADKTFVRPEGLTELVGDLVFRCAGRLSAPTLSIRVFLNANFTTRLGPDGRTEAALLTERPGTRSGTREQPVQGQMAERNAIRWNSVPVPATNGSVDVQIRITGLRVAANQLGVASTLQPSQVVMYYEVETPGKTPLRQAQTVAFIAGPLQPRLAGCNPGIPASAFESTSPENSQLATGTTRGGSMQYIVRFTESYPEHLLPSAAALGLRALPNGLALNAESFDQGTRLMMQIMQVPAGVDLYATVGVVPSASSAVARAKMTSTDLNGSGPLTPVGGNSTGTCAGLELRTAKLPITDGMATAVWEVTGSDPNAIDVFSFGLLVAYRSQPAPALGQSVLLTAYAPTSTNDAASRQAPIPRFAATAVPRNLFAIMPPTVRFVFPGVSNQLGRDSGIRIVNTGPVPGSCTLSYATSPQGLFAPPPQTTPGAIAPGAVLGFTLSSGGSYGVAATPGFAGCVQAVCRFQSATAEFAVFPIGSREPQLRKAAPLSAGADPNGVDPACKFQ